MERVAQREHPDETGAEQTENIHLDERDGREPASAVKRGHLQHFDNTLVGASVLAKWIYQPQWGVCIRAADSVSDTRVEAQAEVRTALRSSLRQKVPQTPPARTRHHGQGPTYAGSVRQDNCCRVWHAVGDRRQT